VVEVSHATVQTLVGSLSQPLSLIPSSLTHFSTIIAAGSPINLEGFHPGFGKVRAPPRRRKPSPACGPCCKASATAVRVCLKPHQKKFLQPSYLFQKVIPRFQGPKKMGPRRDSNPGPLTFSIKPLRLMGLPEASIVLKWVRLEGINDRGWDNEPTRPQGLLWLVCPPCEIMNLILSR